VNPYYFACFWDELLKSDHMAALDPAVSLYGFDGVIRTGSRHLETYLSNLAPQTAVLTAANSGLSGRFEHQSNTGPRASNFVKMMDKPLIAVASYSAAGIAARTAQQQVEPYTIGVIISAIILLTGAILLVAMNTCRRNETRASAAESRLASALNTIKDSFAIYDASGQLTAFNNAFSESFSKENVTADLQSITSYLKSKASTGQQSPDALVSSRKTEATVDNPLLPPERQNEINVGGNRWLRVESSKTPIGETVVYGTDISESRMREAALVERTRQVWAQARKMKDLAETAERATKVKSSFLAAMSHEIRTPLNAINGFAQILGKTAVGEEPQHISKLINQSCRHLLDIVDDILDFTRLEADRVTLHPSRISIQKLMEELVETASILTQGKSVKTSFSIDPETPAHIVADTRRLKQVLLNLVSNAAKFTQTGEIKLLAFRMGDMICFEVADSGDGIAPAIGETIFEPFEQGSFAGRIRTSGTGLGLAITKRLINLMGGGIRYTSQLGVGTTFHVELPCIESAKPQLNTPAAPAANAPLQPLRILIAEDAPSSRLLLRMILTKQGHQVDDVDDGQKALAALVKTEYDLAILDVQMPVMDGLEAAEALRASHGPMTDVPLIALTAQVLDEDVERIRAAGFDKVLGKPFMEEDLVAAIRALAPAPAQATPAPVAAGLHSPVAPELVHNKDA
jgi:signal transduction histidine kinase/ActR/RegA family two-component response regulator